jgi:hypothetical protein
MRIQKVTLAEIAALYEAHKSKRARAHKLPRKWRKSIKPRALLPGAVLVELDRICVVLPIITQTEGNANENKWTRIKRAENQRTITALYLHHLQHVPATTRAIHFDRFAPGKLDPHDNLPSSNKHICDQVCAWLAGDNTITGRGDDGPSCGIAFTYGQVKSDEYGVRVTIT